MSAVCVVPVSEYFALMCASLILFCPGYRCRSRLLLSAAVGYETPISQNVLTPNQLLLLRNTDCQVETAARPYAFIKFDKVGRSPLVLVVAGTAVARTCM